MLPKQGQPTYGWPLYGWPLWPTTIPYIALRMNHSTSEVFSFECTTDVVLRSRSGTQSVFSMTADTKGN